MASLTTLVKASDIEATARTIATTRGSSGSNTTGSQSYIFSDGLNLKIKGDDNVQLLGDGANVILHADYTGNVGIGTTSPSEKLHVNGAAIFDGGAGDSSTDSVLYITKSNNNDWGLYVNASGLDYGMYTRVSNSAGYAFGINNGTTWTTRITGDGRVHLNNKDTIASYDSWLRLNQSGEYGSGVYTPGLMRADGGFQVSGSTVWHAGNDGSGSGLDADLLDGQDSSTFLRILSGGSEANLDSYTDNGVRSVSFTGHSQHLLSWNVGGSTGTVQQLFHYGVPNNGWKIRNKTDNSSWSDWGYVVMASSNQGLISGTIATQSWVNSQGYLTSSSLSGYATQTYVNTAVANLVDSAPGTLDTLNELAASLGDDPNFATTVTNSIATKLPLSGGTLTGTLKLPNLWSSSDLATNSFYVQNATDGFAFGIGTDVSSWFSWDSTAGVKRAIDVWNDGSKILLGDGGHDVEIKNNLYVPNHIFHTDDTDTYMQFHAADQWRVVTGGTERLEVTNATTSITNNLAVTGTVTGSNLNISNWNTAYGWGDHASAGYLTSFDITTQTDSKYLRSNANDNFTGRLTNNSMNETPSYDKGAINLQPSANGGSIGITFRSKVNSTSDAGYIWWYDDNDHYNELNSTENGVLLIAVQNDGGATSEDAIALESSGDIYLNAGVASGAIGSGVWNAARGNVYLGYAGDRARVLSTDDGNPSNWNTAYGWGDHGTAGYALSTDLSAYLPLSGGTLGGPLTINGSLIVNGTITENSSIKIKENVEDLNGSLEKVVNLHPVSYNKIGSQNTELGLIAEEVQSVYPEFVQYDENGEPIGVNYSRLTVALIGAVQELTKRVEELRNKING